ncbi:MAG TPA: hypothetical protein VFC82_03660 [Actinomycetaceae bacterium]|nr:hypothetical protein [Actinomycetaceae bacterium]
MKNAVRTVVAITALTLGLSACQASFVPSPDPQPAPPEPGPVLSTDRLDGILDEIGETLTSADAATSAEELSDRITGPAREMRSAEYQLASISGGANPVTPIETEPQVSIIPATTAWPRVAGVVTTIPEGTNLPELLTLVQEDARDPFALWSWVRLFPGVTVPATTAPVTGSAPVAPDSDTLRFTPQATLEAYVDILNNGDDSESAGDFEADPFRTGYAQTVQSLASAVEAAGTATQQSAVGDDGTHSIGTHEGGAIVVGTVDQVLTVQRTVEDATLTVGPNLAYGGEPGVSGSLIATYLTTIAFYVPPSDSEEPVTVLGAEQVLMGVERDDSTVPTGE